MTAQQDDRTPVSREPEDIRWAINVLLEKIAARFEANETWDMWRSDAAETVRSFKHDLSAAPPAQEEGWRTEAQIKHMVDRFLGWHLPEDFNPDCGVSFKRTFNEHTDHPMKRDPTGTNLFDADQANAMVRYMIEGIPR